MEALKGLSVFYGVNSQRARRNLRGDLEKRSLDINTQFMVAFAQVQEVSCYSQARGVSVPLADASRI